MLKMQLKSLTEPGSQTFNWQVREGHIKKTENKGLTKSLRKTQKEWVSQKTNASSGRMKDAAKR